MSERWHDNLEQAVAKVACAIREQTEQQSIEFEWTRSHHGLATKQDLKDMEARLIKTILEHSGITPSIELAAMLVQSALDKLDASIPDKVRETLCQ